MSEAIELYRKDGSATGVFYCSECRAVFPDQEQAQWCHGERICECGEKVPRYYSSCQSCRSKEWAGAEAIKERERFESAKKITESEYTEEMVYSGDKYYTSVEEALEDYDEGEQPSYVWGCKDVGISKASPDSIYENMLDGMWEDADKSDLNGREELEAAIVAFNKANESIQVWEPDYSTAILTGADRGKNMEK